MRPSQFPRVVVINLESRPDRWERISAQLNALGIVAERFNAIKHEIGWIGCSLSHQSCVQTAIDEPWLLVLEDDCEFTEDFSKSYSKILYELEQNIHGWELFNGGPTFAANPIIAPFLIQNDLFYVHGWAAHFSLYNKWSFPHVLTWSEGYGVMDNYLRELSNDLQANFRMISYVNHLATQYNSHSDLRNVSLDYSKLFNYSSNKLKKAKQNYLDVGPRFRRISVQHPEWKGNLILSGQSDFLFHERHGSRGRYNLAGSSLVVDWDDFGRQEFRYQDGQYSFV